MQWDKIGLYDLLLSQRKESLRRVITKSTPLQQQRFAKLGIVLAHVQAQTPRSSIVYNDMRLQIRSIQNITTFLHIIFFMYYLVTQMSLFFFGTSNPSSVILINLALTFLFGAPLGSAVDYTRAQGTKDIETEIRNGLMHLENKLERIIDGIPMGTGNVKLANYLENLSRQYKFRINPTVRGKVQRVAEKISAIDVLQRKGLSRNVILKITNM
jgi:hypothetical protein